MTEKITDHDWESLSTINAAVGGGQVTRLRMISFAQPWRDGAARPVLALEPVAAAVADRPFPAQLRAALQALSAALTTFSAYYVEHTLPDPLIVTEEWRFFNWADGASVPTSEAPTVPEPSETHAAEMQQLALRLCDAYDLLAEICGRDRKIRKHIQRDP